MYYFITFHFETKYPRMNEVLLQIRYSVSIIAGGSAWWTYGLAISTRSIDQGSIVSQRGISTRSIPRSIASSSGTLMRLIELVGMDLSRGSIIIWRIGSNVNWRMGEEDSEIKGTERAKGKREAQRETSRNANCTHSLYLKKISLIYAKFGKIFDINENHPFTIAIL